MIQNQPGKYGYMKTLNDIRNFLAATQYDMSRRSYLGKVVDDYGYIKIKPNCYGPAMMEEILLYCLTADIDEKEAAIALGIEPRFQAIGIDELFAIDVFWSLQGLQPLPFHALHCYKRVYLDGERFYPPEVEHSPHIKIPEPKYLYVGTEYTTLKGYDCNGLRDYLMESFSECSIERRELANGKTILDISHKGPFDLNTEALYFLLEYEVEELLESYHSPRYHCTKAFQHYMALGIMSFNGGHINDQDVMLRRTEWKLEHGLVGATGEHLLSSALPVHPFQAEIDEKKRLAAAKKGITATPKGTVVPKETATAKLQPLPLFDVAEAA